MDPDFNREVVQYYKSCLERAEKKYFKAKQIFTEQWNEQNPNGTNAGMEFYLTMRLQKYSNAVEFFSSTYYKLIRINPTFGSTKVTKQPSKPKSQNHVTSKAKGEKTGHGALDANESGSPQDSDSMSKKDGCSQDSESKTDDDGSSQDSDSISGYSSDFQREMKVIYNFKKYTHRGSKGSFGLREL